MKSRIALGILILANLAILLTNTAITARASGPANPYWMESAVATSNTQFSPPAVGTNGMYSGIDGWYVSNNGGALFKVQPSGATSVSFPQVGGQLAASQLPTTATCVFNGTIGTNNTITITKCQ